MSTSDGAPDASAGNDEKRITDAVQAITERRAVIEQAKGMLMFVYGIDADQAFDVLRRNPRSTTSNCGSSRSRS